MSKPLYQSGGQIKEYGTDLANLGWIVGEMRYLLSAPSARWLPCDGSVQTKSSYTDYSAILPSPQLPDYVPTISLLPGTTTTSYVIGYDPSNSRYLAVAAAVGYYSTDKVTWTAMTTPPAVIPTFIFSGNGILVSMGASGKIYISSDGGATWADKTNTGAFNGQGRKALWVSSLSLWVLCGDGGIIATTPDFATITARTSGTSANLFGMDTDGTTIVIVGTANTCLSSTNGTSWTARTIFPAVASATINQVCYGGGYFIATGTLGSFAYSTNGTSWTISHKNSGFAAATLATSNSLYYDSTLGLFLQITPGNPAVALYSNDGTLRVVFLQGVGQASFFTGGPGGLYIPATGEIMTSQTASAAVVVYPRYSFTTSTQFSMPLMGPLASMSSPGRFYMYMGET